MSPWFWELRSGGEFLPPEIANFGEGWQDWKGPLQDAPPVVAEIFVRELIQNFVDASRDHKLRNPQLSAVPKLSFEFHQLEGDAGKAISEKIGLSSHADRYKSLTNDEKRSLKIGNSRVLQGETDLFQVLVVRESYTTGMSGPWEMTDRRNDADGNVIVRKMRSALLATVGQRSTNGLGAYGEGKRAVIGASAPRILFAYTCFQVQKVSGNVSRRFLGGTYWRPHTESAINGAPIDQKSATGLALWGSGISGSDRTHAGRPVPFDNEAADDLVKSLNIPGLTVRDPGKDQDFGTTLVFVEPVFSASEIKWAIERNWWPLIIDNGAEFEVSDFDGQRLEIQPDTRAELKPFINCYEVMKGQSKGYVREPDGSMNDPVTGNLISAEDVAREDLVAELRCVATGANPVGVLGLSIDCGLDGWSWKDRDSNWTIVALVRDGMIIEYEPFARKRQGSPPFARGVFSTSISQNPISSDLLRNAEPPLHNHWVEKDGSFPADSVELAKQLYDLIGKRTKDFRAKYMLKPEPSTETFEEFGDAFDDTGDEVAPPKPPKPPNPPKPGDTTKPPKPPKPGGTTKPASIDPWENQSGNSALDPHINSHDLIRARAVRKIRLKSECLFDDLKVVITLGWQVQEENSFEDDASLLDAHATTVPAGFVKKTGLYGLVQYEGVITKEWSEFEIHSNFYSSLWAVRPFSIVAPVINSGGDE